MKVDVYSSPWNDLEEVLRGFLLRASLCNEGVIYIISPWISNIPFERTLISHPKLMCNNMLDALKQLKKFFDVKVVTRCYDDRISPTELYTAKLLLQEIEGRKSSALIPVLSEIVENLMGALETVTMIRALIAENIDVRFLHNLHAKIYVSPAEALIGSANLTISGMKSKSKYANSEILVKVSKEDAAYYEILRVAKQYFEMGVSEEECIKGMLKKINTTLHEVGLQFNNLREIEMFIDNLREQCIKLSLRTI